VFGVDADVAMIQVVTVIIEKNPAKRGCYCCSCVSSVAVKAVYDVIFRVI